MSDPRSPDDPVEQPESPPDRPASDDAPVARAGGSEGKKVEGKRVQPGDTAEPERHPKAAPAVSRQTRIGAAWVAVAVAVVVLVVLLIFILQNQQQVDVRFFGLQGRLPGGVLVLLSAAGGALLVIVLGVARIFQLRWLARRDRRTARGRR